LSIWKKAISVATSAALLASLLVATVAPAAFASTTVTGVGSVGRGQTSTTAATFLFTENSAADLDAASNFDVYIFDSAGNCALPATDAVNVAASTVTFVGPATISAPGSLGATVTLGSSSFNVKWTAFDEFNVETILIGGLKIKAATGAATGAMKACVYNDAGGNFADAFGSENVTAAGKLAQAYGIGTTQFDVALDVGSCPFAGTNTVTVGGESVTVTSVLADTPVVGQYRFANAGDPFVSNQLANAIVTQTVPNCGILVLGSPGSVVDSLIYNAPDGQARLNPGETNQWANYNLSATERTAGTLTKDSTLTLTISTAGVTFSKAPRAAFSGTSAGSGSPSATSGVALTLTGALGTNPNVYGVLSADKKSVTWTVSAVSTTAATIVFWDIFYDVASVATGTSVDVTLASSALAVQPSSRSNAVIGRVLNATATSPVVYIGENNQAAGQVTVVETGAGFFQEGTGSNNTLAICLTYNTFENEQFASAPWAKVTAGDLKLREGTGASTDNVVQGTPFFTFGYPFACYYWTVWTASTTASTVVMSGDEAGTVGLKINVPAGSPIGPVTASIRTGDISTGVFNMILEVRVQIALRQFRNQVAVTALSQPLIPVGSNGSAVGNIQIQETANGQLKFNERICVEIVPNQNWNSLFDAYMKGLNTADVPIVTASNGILVNAVSLSFAGCNGQDRVVGGFGGTLIESFSFYVTQQSITGNGKLVISNIKYATVNDAVEGPVQVNVYGYGSGNTLIDFQSLISNAKIGVPVKLSIGAVSALGLRPTSGYTTKTPKTQAAGKYVTWKFTGGATLAGQRVNILVAVRINGAWGGPKYLKSAWADANGIVTFFWKAAAGTVLNARAQWPGDANHQVSTSSALGTYWK